MPYGSTYTRGSWKAICDVCGREFKAHELRQRWDGLMTCLGDWETRHPQDFVRGVADKVVPPWVRPEAADYFIYPYKTTTADRTINGAPIDSTEIN